MLPDKTPYEQGYQAQVEGQPQSANPFPRVTAEDEKAPYWLWHAGWVKSQQDDERCRCGSLGAASPPSEK